MGDVISLIGTTAGVCSLLLAIWLEWGRIKARLAGLFHRSEEPISKDVIVLAPDEPNHESVAGESVIRETKRDESGWMRWIKTILATFVGVLYGSMVGGVMIALVSVPFEIPRSYVFHFFQVVGFILGFTYLKHRSLSLILALFGFFLLLVG